MDKSGVCSVKRRRIFRGGFVRAVLFIFICALHSFAHGANGESPPIPRFVSLNTALVYVRVGPSKTYPVIWTLAREKMPVEVFLEFDSWRKIRDVEGTEGWVHKSMLSGKRSVVFIEGKHPVFKNLKETSKPIAYAAKGVVGILKKIQGNWCYVQIDTLTGWVSRSAIWGVYPHEDNFSQGKFCKWFPFLCGEAKAKKLISNEDEKPQEEERGQ